MPNRARVPDPIDAEVGSRIAARRTALGLSQSALAGRLGISFQQLQKYEAGVNRVSASRLHAIATGLGAPIGAFFPQEAAGSDPPRPIPAGLTAMLRSSEGRAVAADFARIPDRSARRAVSRIVTALARQA